MYQKQNYKKAKKILSVLVLSAFLVMAFSIFSFAEDTTSGGSVTVSEETDITVQGILDSDAMKTLKSIVTTLVNPISSVAMGAAIFSLAFARDSKQTENSLKAIKAIVIGFVLINSLGLTLTAIGSIVGVHTYTFK